MIPTSKYLLLITAALALLVLLCACSGNEPAAETSSGTDSTVPSAGGAEVTELVLATLNIKHGAEGLEKVAEAIREVSPDIIGLQEVDVGCSRSGYLDEPAVLAQLAGYEHYAFAKATTLGFGEYGTALLSRYPIERFEVIPLDSGSGEDRALGHAVIDVGGLKLHVFVTHLSFEDRTVRIAQMQTIGGLLDGCDRYALLGDLNSFDLTDIRYLDAFYYVNRPDRRYGTFRRFHDAAPDNIVVSDGFTELSSGTLDSDCSDHNLLYAVFSIDQN